MKVRELVEQLKGTNQEAIVIMSSDGEGNSFSPLADFGSVDTYKANTTYSGEVGYSRLTDELKSKGYSVEDVVEGGEPALVIYPTN